MPDPLDGLGSAQAQAVAHEKGPLLVLGGAGTGKTLALTRRFSWLVEQGCGPGAILALTYSPSAAIELRERLETAVAVPYEELAVATFHSFCAGLLREEAIEAGLDPFFAPVTQADRLALLLDTIDELTLRHHEIRGNPVPLLASFIARIDRLKEEMVSAADLTAWAHGLAAEADGDGARGHAVREREFARVYEDHDRLLAARGALDFGDLVLHSFRLLHERPHVRERVAERYRHVLVDEFQEVNFAQGALLRLLTQDHGNLWAAGDDDQAIHRFRGAAAKNLEEFMREHGSASVVRLERSHRCAQRLLDAAGAVLDPTPGRISKKLKGSGRGEVRFWRARSERAQAQAMAAEAERLIEQRGVAADRIAVLVRSVKGEGDVVG
ncbi:MAG: ATP-dependent helicase, partial [Thermoleophilaceae bacterium]|nr:ATP-dependent helicase [Thermoleophilaceae bacterium]